MGIYIPDSDMPKNCCVCDLCDGEYGREYYEKAYCRAKNGIRVSPKRRPKGCPLIEVKTPHGRLIDEDDINATWHMGDSGEVLDYVAPTVIESEVE